MAEVRPHRLYFRLDTALPPVLASPVNLSHARHIARKGTIPDMHLSKISLFGFKSFADKIDLTLEPGVTCIVGPNGCGKSNVSDAIR